MHEPEARRVNSHRYPGYDYSQAGMVFVTVCTQGRQCLFGEVMHGEMDFSAAGKALTQRWQMIPQRFPDVGIDAFVVMPDHLHGILLIGIDPVSESTGSTAGDVVRWLKTALLRDYSHGVKTSGWEPYDRVLWQRDYYDRIIRNETELETRRAYIDSNPSRWRHANKG